MIYYKTKSEIEIMRKSAELVGEVLAEVAQYIKVGITTKQLDTLAEKYIESKGARPSFKNYKGYPFATCISVNDAVVHGFPSDEPLKAGDIISVDVGVFKNSFHGDSAYTFALKGATEQDLKLLKITKQSLYKGIEKAIAGNRIGDIANAIQHFTETEHGYGVVRELVGHGVGRYLHEDPQVPNYGKRGSGTKLKEGLVIAIEPMINEGTKDVFHDDDGWTVRTADKKKSAHYEHNVCIQKGQPDILTSFELIEKAEKENPELESGYY